MGKSNLASNRRNSDSPHPGDTVRIDDEVHDHIPGCANCGKLTRFSSGGHAVVKLDSGETLRVRPEDIKVLERKS